MSNHFRQIWCCDFEFGAPDGGLPKPYCMVAREFNSNRLVRLWADEFGPQPPFSVDEDSLFVAYYSSAEMGCFLSLGWQLPTRIVDLYCEFKQITNGLLTLAGNSSLLGALVHFGLTGIDATEKKEMRDLAIRGGPFTDDEKAALMDYCQTDVDALAKLLPKMLSKIDVPRALLRGRYMAAVARMERNGVPIDMENLDAIRTNWSALKAKLVETVDTHDVYEGTTFKMNRFEEFLARERIAWPTLPSGKPATDEDTFKDMSKLYPDKIGVLRELRATLSQLKLQNLSVGSDGRNRCLLSPLASKTGRNQPSNTKFIFGPSTWVRSLIKPAHGRAVAYLDYEQQEFGIGAALSGDETMKVAYSSGDPYLAFAKQAGAVPHSATKATHKEIREQFKVCALATQYGMGAKSLAFRLGVPEVRAEELLALHHRTYPTYWRWSDDTEARGMMGLPLTTVFGWTLWNADNPRTLRNFPIQANGAEMLRLACCLLTEAGIAVCAPVHDAVLIEADADEIELVVEEAGRLMQLASQIVLAGFTIRTEAKIARYPERYYDERGKEMWNRVYEITRS